MKNLTKGSEITCSKEAIVNSFYLMHKVHSKQFFYHILEWKMKSLVKPMAMVMKQISSEHKYFYD